MKITNGINLERLRSEIDIFGLSGKDAPPGVSQGHFTKMLWSIKNGGSISGVGISLVSIICDLRHLDLKVRRGSVNAMELSFLKVWELRDAVERVSTEHVEAPVFDPGPIEKRLSELVAHEAAPHPPINILPGTFTVRGGKKVFNLNGTFWTGGQDGLVVIEGFGYRYEEGKKFGKFTKSK